MTLLAVLVSAVPLLVPPPVQDTFEPRVEPASGEGTAAIQGFVPEEGLSIELFAAEPMLANPVCLYVDHGGEVYVGETFRHFQGVTDMRDHMDWLDEDIANRTVEERLAMLRRHEGEAYDEKYARAYEQIRLIRDTDGDGKADEAVVFSNDFKDPAAGIGAGLLSYRGDVFYTCIPDLWLLRDEDGDGKADEQRALSTGYGVNIALLGHDLHGLRIGPDLRLYFSCGDRGFHVQTENGLLEHPLTGAVLRCDLDGRNLEVFHTGLRNPQELVFDEHGNLFTGENNSDGGDRARWVNLVEGADSGWRYSFQWITEPVMRGPWNDERMWHPPFEGQAAYIVPPIANIADGPSGLAYYPGTGLHPRYERHFFLCDFRGDATYSGIHTFQVEPDGAFWKAGEVRRFLWNTLVTDCDFGPDGALYFSDWVHGWNRTGKGRVYRAFDEEVIASPLVEETRQLLASDLRLLETPELQELLSHADQRVRQEAHFALGLRGDVEALARVALDTDAGRLARLHALWGLGIASRTDAGAFGPLLSVGRDGDAEVRAQALRVLGDERHAGAAQRVLDGLADPAPRVRFYAAQAAGRLRLAQAVEPLTRLLAEVGESDRNLRHAGVMGLVGGATEEDLQRLARAEDAHVRMGALLVRRRQASPELARFLGDPDPRLVLEAARAIHDLPVAAALGDLARVDPLLPMAEGFQNALARRVLDANRRVGRAAALAAFGANEALSADLRAEALAHLTRWEDPLPRDPVHNGWMPLEPGAGADLEGLALELLAGPAARGPAPVVRELVRFLLPREAKEIDVALTAWAEDRARPSEVRVAAFKARIERRGAGLAELVRRMLGDPDGGLRAAALTGLEALQPAEAYAALPQILEHGELAERRAAYRILARAEEAEGRELLAQELEKLAADLLPVELALDLVSAAESHAEDPRLAELLGRHRQPRERDPELAPHLDALFGGDADRGKRVFERADLSCVRCHATTDDGAPRIGPDLTGVAGRLSRLQLLESIAVPNRHTTPGYGSTVFFLNDGGLASGRVIEETEYEVKLLDSEGNVTVVDLEDVDERRPDLSAMPKGMLDDLSGHELRDLLHYLTTL